MEVSLAALLLALAVVPLLGAIAGTSREAGFSETYLLAHARVQALLDAVEARGWVSLPPAVTSTSLATPEAAGAPPEVLWRPAPDRYAELVTAERLGDGLVRIGARVRWVAPTAAAGAPPAEIGSHRVLWRPDGSWTRSIPLGYATAGGVN